MRRVLVFGVTVILGALLLIVYATVFVATKTALVRPQVRLLPG